MTNIHGTPNLGGGGSARVENKCPLCGGSGYVTVVWELPRDLLIGTGIAVDRCPLCKGSNRP